MYILWFFTCNLQITNNCSRQHLPHLREIDKYGQWACEYVRYTESRNWVFLYVKTIWCWNSKKEVNSSPLRCVVRPPRIASMLELTLSLCQKHYSCTLILWQISLDGWLSLPQCRAEKQMNKRKLLWSYIGARWSRDKILCAVLHVKKWYSFYHQRFFWLPYTRKLHSMAVYL